MHRSSKHIGLLARYWLCQQSSSHVAWPTAQACKGSSYVSRSSKVCPLVTLIHAACKRNESRLSCKLCHLASNWIIIMLSLRHDLGPMLPKKPVPWSRLIHARPITQLVPATILLLMRRIVTAWAAFSICDCYYSDYVRRMERVD
jgi:hypothetical protein